MDADPKSSICLGAAVAALLAHTAAALADAAEAAAAEPEASAGEAPHLVVPPAVPPAPTGPGMPSWSRKYTTAGAAGTGPRAVRGARYGERGAHAPKPTVRVTAVAAAAALLTVLTATAAQSPDGFGSLTAMFVPQAGASTTGGSAGTGATEAPGGGAAAVGAPQPLARIEASARKPIGQPGWNRRVRLTHQQAVPGQRCAGRGRRGQRPGHRRRSCREAGLRVRRGRNRDRHRSRGSHRGPRTAVEHPEACPDGSCPHQHRTPNYRHTHGNSAGNRLANTHVPGLCFAGYHCPANAWVRRRRHRSGHVAAHHRGSDLHRPAHHHGCSGTNG
ncbi:hypothetical protein NG819_07090 [Pseudarthrobacter sp. Fe7]|nr:hypothetical protein NG819_07090 [Pseudarthrobacter sp. Fe7]